MIDKQDDKMDTFTLPEARLINCSLFTKDAFNDKSVPSYKLEVAISLEDVEGIERVEDVLFDAADSKWGEGAGDDEDLVLPLLNGDKLAKKREKKGKQGDAYKGMIVIRANTIYNKDGIDGSGGIQVFDEEAELVPVARQGEIYQGCYGIAAVNIGFYETDDGDHAMKFYLAAFQKTKDGERLMTASDKSNLFKPTGRKKRTAEGGEGTEGKRRRRRREQ